MKSKIHTIKIERLMIFLTWFLMSVILSLGIVTAADHTVGGSDFDSIQNVVDSSASNDRILLGSKTYTSSGSVITVGGNKNLTIQGQSNSNRATLNANNLHGILYIRDGSSATIRYVNFVNGGLTGHALGAYGTILIENCSFSGSRGDSGAAIVVNGTASNSIIRNCNFTNNYADNHGDNDYTAGGAICVHGADNVEIRNCYFSGNKALDNGGALVIREDATNTRIISCTFINNQAPNGGAILNQLATTTITGCTFTNNKATNVGGAIYSISSLNIVNSNFNNNNAKNGGAIYNTNSLRVTGSNFATNTAENGGAIYSTSAVNIGSSSFNKNTAKNNGGGIYTIGTSRSTITGSKFTSNSAKNGGGIYNNAPLAISTSNLVSNKASANGGGIYANKNLNITGGNIKSNNASYGSGVYNIAILRLIKLPSLSKNSESPTAMLLNVKSTVKPATKLNIQAALKKRNNVKGLNGIYTTNTNVFKGNTRLAISNYVSNQNIFFTISGKTYKKNSGKTGIAKYSLKTANKNNYKIKITVKTSYNKKTFKKSATVTVRKATVTSKGTGTSSPNSGQKVTVIAEDMLYINATYNTKNIKKINFKSISYYNVKKANNIVDKYYYRVKSDGWYIGKKDNSGKFTWTGTSKPSSAGNWYNATYNMVNDKIIINNKITPFTDSKSNNLAHFFVTLKNSKSSSDLKPYILNTYNITKTDDTTSLVNIYETATTDIYFSSLGFSSNLKNESTHKEGRVQVNNSDFKNLVIKIFQGKSGYGDGIVGVLSPDVKIKTIYKWIKSNMGYLYYSESHYTASDVLWRLMNKKIDLHANCVDQSIFLVTILRTAGVPSYFEHFNSAYPKKGGGYKIIGHVWVRAFYNNTKTYKLDTTSSRNAVDVINSWVLSKSSSKKKKIRHLIDDLYRNLVGKNNRP